MSEDIEETKNWYLGQFIVAFMVNAVLLIAGVFTGPNQDQSAPILFLLWSMAVGVSSCWLAIVHLLYCRAEKKKKIYILYYFIPGLLLLLTFMYIELPLPDTNNNGKQNLINQENGK